MRIGVTIEARMTSSRLPGKVLMEACGKSMLELMVERVKCVNGLDEIILATTNNDTDDCLAFLAEKMGISCFRGSEHDVLGRILKASEEYNIDIIVELTGDCPLIDPACIEKVIDEFFQNKPDYATNALSKTYPLGMEAQVFPSSILAEVAQLTNDPLDREHVTLYIYKNTEKYNVLSISADGIHNRPEFQLTLDEKDDYKLIKNIFENLYIQKPDFTLSDIIQFLDRHPAIANVNSNVNRTILSI